jgi:hypothetical protein
VAGLAARVAQLFDRGDALSEAEQLMAGQLERTKRPTTHVVDALVDHQVDGRRFLVVRRRHRKRSLNLQWLVAARPGSAAAQAVVLIGGVNVHRAHRLLTQLDVLQKATLHVARLAHIVFAVRAPQNVNPPPTISRRYHIRPTHYSRLAILAWLHRRRSLDRGVENLGLGADPILAWLHRRRSLDRGVEGLGLGAGPILAWLHRRRSLDRGVEGLGLGAGREFGI